MSEHIRIGRPPGQPTLPLPRRRWLLWVGGAVVFAALVAGAALYGVSAARHDANKPSGFAAWQPAAFPSPSVNPANEAVTCYVMIPVLSDSVTEFTAILDDPKRSTTKAETAAGTLRAVEVSAPQAWRADIAAQYTGLEQMIDAHGDPARIAQIDADAFSDSGIRLAHACKPYAS